MEDSHGLDVEEGLILKVLGVDLCARAILDHVPVADLVRSERVCKGWQRAVQTYLQTCRSLSLYDTNCTPRSAHRSIYISVDDDFLLPYGIVEKFGSSMIKVTTERSNDEYFELIASQCPHLQEIVVGMTDRKYQSQLNLIKKFKQMKHIKIRYLYAAPSYKTDEVLGKLFQNIDCETIKLTFGAYTDFTGSFLKSIGSSNLKLLNIANSNCLDVSNFLTDMHVLRNVTSLILKRNNFSVMDNVYLLLVQMPQLEELNLSKYPKAVDSELSKKIIEAISGLVNLRRLNVAENFIVTDALLEAVARGCKKLEYLNISRCPLDCAGVSQLTARGLAALCRRSPSAATTLYFGNFKDQTYDKQFRAHVRNNPLLPELVSQCCLDMTPQWWESTCRASQGRIHPVELNSNCNPVQHQDQRHKLKIALNWTPWTRQTCF